MSSEHGSDRPVRADLETLQYRLRCFADDRAWAEFHSPKNLLIALVSEVGELAELFAWLTDDQAALVMADAERAARIRDELADVLGCLMRLADVLGVGLTEAFEAKLTANALKYPVERARGNATKYTQLE